MITDLNPEQRKAAETTEGPVLILAGAGSGKTTVLVERIAYMIDEVGIDPYNILAITFTNKAAREMQNRISARIGEDARFVWISTFHSLCVRILRRYADRLGFTHDFVIFDSADQQTVIRDCVAELGFDARDFSPRSVISHISAAKDNLMDAKLYTATNDGGYDAEIARIYTLYERRLKECNAMDFDDIILNAVKLLSENPDVLEYYQNRFQYVMVDEYQDTNNVQYVLISLLSGHSNNLCVVGDDDQSIYKFRGANIRNILDFEEEHEDALVIKLEQNYRSTQNILSAANAVIANNDGRKVKSLWTDNGAGAKLHYEKVSDESDEANTLVNDIIKYHTKGGGYADCAVLYRTNAQSRAIEEALIGNGVPYRVLAGLRFFDRKEIKDITAYLRVVLNPNDNVSLTRIINTPKRGIGASTVEKLQDKSHESGKSMYEIIKSIGDYPEFARAKAKLDGFAAIIDELQDAAEDMKIDELMNAVIKRSGYEAALNEENTVESRTRLENLQEYVSAAKDYIDADSEGAGTLAGFLESVTLISDVDTYDENADAVVLMTIHSSKGLEFERVYLPGMEEGIFPSRRSAVVAEELEEERRLCYVAFTRAKRELFIYSTQYRRIYGKTEYMQPSRFIDEIPKELFDDNSAVKRPRTHTRPYYGSYRADLQQRKQEKPRADIDFAAGDRVLHKAFGEGTVISCERVGNDAKVVINFDSVGQKVLLAAFAKMKRI